MLGDLDRSLFERLHVTIGAHYVSIDPLEILAAQGTGASPAIAQARPAADPDLGAGRALKGPAIIVSSRAYNLARPDVVVMAVTSQLRPTASLGEVFVDRWQAAGLLKPSVIKPVFATIEHRLVIRQLGTLSAGDQAALKQAIAEILS